MDCVIPGHNVRSFCSAVACLGRIGKELYVDFDQLDGLTLRTLNDAKSAYASFHFDPGFFERCSAPVGVGSGEGSGRRCGSGRSRKRQRCNGHRRGGAPRTDNGNDNDEDDGKYLCRVPLRTVHAVLRQRRGVVSLRVRSSGAAPPPVDGNDYDNGGVVGRGDADSLLMQLSFEFRVESPAKHGGNMRIVHRIGVSDADAVTAVAPRDGCSEIVASPKVALRMLDPLKRTAEVALTVDDTSKVVTATSFHHGDAAAASTNNDLLRAASAAVLKTETSIGCDEFDDYNYRDDRNVSRDEDVQDDGGDGGAGRPPSDVNEKAILVFGIKEAKAMLQFCSQANLDEEMRAVISFHWGGRPIIFETEADSFSAELILATLDHKMLAGMNLARKQPGGSADAEGSRQRNSSGSTRSTGDGAE